MSDFDPYDFAEDDPFADAIRERTYTEVRDVVGGLDAEWFRQHPRFTKRIRKYVPGEFDNETGGVCGDPGDSVVVLVRRDGIKVLFLVGTFDGRETEAGGLP
ncbi:hypothetical protein [Nocardioides sp. Arc9.136]|uniref:hypothetical protein n=1 Tax=Nocardioides sp. Arc9.136 TaxID=2996826 RepID=UPI002666F19D|nr:hypothetical protein [Nocardioides sp. Arc9.136]WKN48843.1 hypothetical protein OSR43_01605 [Nocardioides sp. Arc9.136]